jgi:hypothetical protein
MTHLSRGFRLVLIFASAGWAPITSSKARVDPFKDAINDPVFGQYYTPRQAKFERVPFSSLGAACQQYERAFYPTSKRPTAYLYARYDYGSTHIWIIGINNGTMLFVRRGDGCATTNPVIALRQPYLPASRLREEPIISRSEAADVFSDLLRRFTKAFRGKAGFLIWLDAYTEAVDRTCSDASRLTCPPTWHLLPDDLQEMLQDFRTGP